MTPALAAPRRASITIDLDGVRYYHAIHGLPPPGSGDPILERGVPRFLEVCTRLGVPATLFVVGADLADDACADLVRKAARAGHEIGSHSFHHRYDLSRAAPAAIQADVARSIDAITDVTGVRPRGFRAPGYNLSEPLMDALELCGFAYDSSILPSPAYYALRAAAIAAHRLRGAPSASLVGDARAFLAPNHPYRPRQGACFRPARSRVEGRDLVELPITALRGGVPLLGTALVLAPSPAVAALTAAAVSTSTACVLELHAIDLCDADDGFDRRLVRIQRELAVPVATKIERIETALRVLVQSTEVVTLDALASQLASQLGE